MTGQSGIQTCWPLNLQSGALSTELSDTCNQTSLTITNSYVIMFILIFLKIDFGEAIKCQ